jgi:hypothetical protein
VVSGEAFRADAHFRTEARQKLPSSHRLFASGQMPDASAYRVVFAVSPWNDGIVLFNGSNTDEGCR